MASLEQETMDERAVYKLFCDLQEFTDSHLFDNVDPILDIAAEGFPTDQDFPDEVYSDFLSQGQIYDAQSSHHVLVSNPPADGSYSFDLANMILKSVKQANKAFLMEAAADFDDKQPSFNSIIDYDACISELSEHAVEQPRRNHSQVDESQVPLQLHQHENANPSLSELLFRANPLDHDNVSQRKLLNESHHDLLDNHQLFMFEDDDSKDFSSWFLFDSDDENEIALFKKNILGEEDPTVTHLINRQKRKYVAENPCAHKTKAQANTDVPKLLIDMGSLDIPQDKSLNPKLCSGISSSSNSNSSIASDSRTVDEQNTTAPTRKDDLDNQSQPPDPPSDDDELNFNDAIVKTSTPNESKHESFISSNQAVWEASSPVFREESPIRETRRSKYFIRNKRTIGISKGPSF